MKKLILASVFVMAGVLSAAAQSNSTSTEKTGTTKSCCSKGTTTQTTSSCCSKGTTSTGTKSCHGGTTEVKGTTKEVKSDAKVTRQTTGRTKKEEEVK